jgi:hypothetical protein
VALLSLIADPKELHVDCSRLALFAGPIGDSIYGGIISLEWSGGLWIAHFFEGCPYSTVTSFAFKKKAPSSCFGSR